MKLETNTSDKRFNDMGINKEDTRTHFTDTGASTGDTIVAMITRVRLITQVAQIRWARQS